MPAYYDTGTLVPLYVTERFSDAVNAFFKFVPGFCIK